MHTMYNCFVLNGYTACIFMVRTFYRMAKPQPEYGQGVYMRKISMLPLVLC